MTQMVLSDKEIARQLGSLQGWARLGDEITKTYELKDFVEAVGFIVSVAIVAERAGHHPDIDIRWNKVKLSLSTHSEGGLTEKDFRLADDIDRVK
jgi:4a-hydroxytetrahydrobiopterin dehydratase